MSSRGSQIRLAALVSASLWCGHALLAGQNTAAEPDDSPKLARGLVLSFGRTEKRNGQSVWKAFDARRARLASIYVAAGSTPSPFVLAGPFEARWEGFIDCEFLDDFTFYLAGSGTVELRINDKVIAQGKGKDLNKVEPVTVELEQGKNALSLRYKHSGDTRAGDAWVRLDWSSLDFGREPIPPRVLYHRPEHPDLQRGLQRRLGRDLYTERRCHGCHDNAGIHLGDEGGVRGEKDAMPELAMDAPALTALGDRLRAEWLAAWVRDPRAIRKKARMPQVLHGSAAELDRAAWDIARFLTSLQSGSAKLAAKPAWLDSKHAEEGARLWGELGCLACHRLGEAQGPLERVTLARVRSKWWPEALVEYLQQPERHYRWVRMPNFGLSVAESRALAAHILTTGQEAVTAPHGAHTADATRGRRLVEESGCLNCHELKSESRNRRTALPREPNVDRGCLAPEEARRGRAPDFRLSPDERRALARFVRDEQASLKRYSPAEFSARQVKALRCGACHSRDGQLDHWTLLTEDPDAPPIPEAAPDPPVEGEEKQVLQIRPHLTWAGEKLRPEWTERFLVGQVKKPTRPWLRARMPSFPARAAGLAHGFALEHGLPPTTRPDVKRDTKRAAIGKQLVRVDGGFSCITCHDVGKFGAVGVFDTRGVNLAYARDRLRYDFFIRWMLRPPRVAPETRMPQFADDEGRSPYGQYFDGDAAKQFDAIWHYLLAGERVEKPE